MTCTSAINDERYDEDDAREAEGDRLHDDRMARIDAGEECPDCASRDTFPTTSGPNYRIPLFECRHCKATWFDCITRPALDDRTLDLFGAA